MRNNILTFTYTTVNIIAYFTGFYKRQSPNHVDLIPIFFLSFYYTAKLYLPQGTSETAEKVQIRVILNETK